MARSALAVDESGAAQHRGSGEETANFKLDGPQEGAECTVWMLMFEGRVRRAAGKRLGHGHNVGKGKYRTAPLSKGISVDVEGNS